MNNPRYLQWIEFHCETARALNINIDGPELLLPSNNASKPYTIQTGPEWYRTFLPCYRGASWEVRMLRIKLHLATVFNLNDMQRNSDILHLLTVKINTELSKQKSNDSIVINCRNAPPPTSFQCVLHPISKQKTKRKREPPPPPLA